jgi:hypothetical protein
MDQKFCGVSLFCWNECEEIEIGQLVFYDPVWLLDSMKEYDNFPLDINIEGEMNIFDKQGCELVWSGFVIDITEVKEILLSK